MDSQTNIRPISILAGYMLAAAVLTWKSIAVILQQKAARGRPVHGDLRRKLLICSFLALLSLATTWFYMFAFFAQSYREWHAANPLLTDDVSGLRLGSWLRDTSLFKLAWGTAMETDARFWWTQQIFGFCAVWSLMLASQGHRKRIHGTWIFMILGQIVAISFASNLSFLAMLLGSEPKTASPSGSRRVGAWLYIISAVNFTCVAAIPYIRDERYFLQVLLMPHVMAFLPMLLMARSTGTTNSSIVISPEAMVVALSAILQAQTTSRVVSHGGSLTEIASAFHQHPAVTSVSWDVILCWISYGAWYVIGN